MARSRTNAVELRRSFVVHLGAFVAVTLGAVIMTIALGASYWWLPFAVIWGVCVAIDGALAFIWAAFGRKERGLAYWLRMGMSGTRRPAETAETAEPARRSPSPMR